MDGESSSGGTGHAPGGGAGVLRAVPRDAALQRVAQLARARWRHVAAHAAAYLVLAVNLLAASAAFLYVRGAVAAQQAARFEERAKDAVDAIRDRMDAYVAALRGARGLFAGGREPDRPAFAAFVASLELGRAYAGVQGLGWTVRIRGPVAALEREVRAQGIPDFRVWPRGTREPETTIVYLEPLDWRNARALGFDMASESVRRAAMERARDTGSPACSGRVELVQEHGVDRQPGFLVYLAVYAGEPATAEARRAQLRGFVYAPFRAADLLRAALAQAPIDSMALDVMDGEAGDARDLLYRSRLPPPRASLERVARLEVAGHPWTLRFSALPGFAARWEAWLPRIVLLGGLAIALALFRVTLREACSREAAESSARRASFLAEAGEVLASSLDYRATVAEVARIAARSEADYCAVLLLDPDGPLRLVGHRGGEEARRAGELIAGVGLEPEGRWSAAALLTAGAPFVAHDLPPAALVRLARSPEQASLAARVRLASVLSVPLRARGEAVGAITFASSDPERRFGEADLALLEDLARLVVAAVDTARLYARAQEAVRVRDEFLSIASHELRTPLTSLGLQADTLLLSAPRVAPEVVARRAGIIRRNVDRLTRLVSALLDMSRLVDGELSLDLEEVDLADVARDVAARLQDQATSAGCELRLDLEPARGRWDRLRLDQVVTNLLGNAVKYGAGAPVTVATRASGGRARLEVSDQGIGIPLDAQERIFRRFERAVSERNYGGFGLGLWIVRRIVDALAGEVRVVSAPGRGATFTVELPCEARAPAEPPSGAAGGATPRVRADADQMRESVARGERGAAR
jgi:signal transduction histidine kinase/CHASE1-domain containing sensor protein